MKLLQSSAAAAAIAALALAAPATAAETITVDRAAKRDCLTPAAGERGVHTTRFTAPTTGLVDFRLRAASGDWDLALFDGSSRVGGSAGFGANELARTLVRKGQQLTVQACRRSGRSARASLARGFTELVRTELEEKPMLVRVPFVDRAVVPRMEAAGLDVTHNAHSGFVDVVLHSAADRDVLARLGLPHYVLIEDMLAAERNERAKDRAYSARLAQEGSPLPTGRTDYRQPEDYPAELKQIAETYPQLVKSMTLKEKSFEGRDIAAIEIAADVANDKGRPVFVLNALHHAREWPAAEGAMEFAWMLVKGYGSDPRITKLLDTTRIVVMPVTNPDGFQVSRTAPNPDPDEEQGVGTVYSTATGVVILGGSLSYKRKNCNPGPNVPAAGQPCEFAIGVDPNRNYAESWGGPGASSNPNDQSYRGTAPFSEPEPRAVKELVSQLNPTGLITTHNVAALVLRPPGLESEGFAPDEGYMEALGEKMAIATGYTNQYGWQLYDTTGTTDDWTYPTTGGWGYTIEMGPSSGFFHGSYEVHVVNQWTGDGDTAIGGLREAYLTAAEHARDPSFAARITGRAPAGRTLRITKAFQTASYPVCGVADVAIVDSTCAPQGDVIMTDEKLDFSTKVPASGRYEWWVNPSTRPFVGREGKIESYKLTCEQDGQVLQETEVVIGRGEVKTIDLPCGGTLTDPAGGANGVTAKLLEIKRAKGGRAAKVRVQVLGGSLSKARITVKKGKRKLGSKRVKTLTGTRTIKVKARKGRLKKGRYTVVLRAENLRVKKSLKSR